MSTYRVRTPLQLVANIVGPPAAVLAAWLMSRGHAGNGGMTQANVALVMAAVTVLFALLDWLAGITTSIAAALALNYFHTQPLHTLRVTDSRDMWSIALLFGLGLTVSAATAFRVRLGMHHIRQADVAAAAEELRATLTENHPAPLVWSAAIATPANDLGLVLAHVERVAPTNVPAIGRPAGSYRSLDGELLDGDLVLPVYGAALRLERVHPEGRWLVLTPRDGMGPLTLDRRAVMAFADTIELALDTSDAELAAATLAS
jgi:energy-converting hydrogenase Eha subunit A